MKTYSEYMLVNEGLKDWCGAIVDKLKGILPTVSLNGIASLLKKSKLGMFFAGVVDKIRDTQPATSKQNNNIKANIEFMLSQSGVKEALNGFGEDAYQYSDIPIVDASEMKEILADVMEEISESNYNPANHHDIQTVCIYGAIGIGKTTILKQVIAEWNASNAKNTRGLILLDGGQLTTDSFIMPSLIDVKDDATKIAGRVNVALNIADKSNTTRLGAAPMSVLPVFKPTGDAKTDRELDAIANGHVGNGGISVDGGLIVIDEFLRADPSVFKKIMNIIQQRNIAGEYILGSKWAFVLLSNRPCDDEEVASAYDRLTQAFQDRISPYLYIPKLNDWVSWAKDNGVADIVTDYISANPDKLHASTQDASFTLDPRNWEEVSKIVVKTQKKYDSDTILDKLHTVRYLRSAHQVVSDNGNAAIFIKQISSKIGVAEARLFCEYWMNVIKKGPDSESKDVKERASKKSINTPADFLRTFGSMLRSNVEDDSIDREYSRTGSLSVEEVRDELDDSLDSVKQYSKFLQTNVYPAVTGIEIPGEYIPSVLCAFRCKGMNPDSSLPYFKNDEYDTSMEDGGLLYVIDQIRGDISHFHNPLSGFYVLINALWLLNTDDNLLYEEESLKKSIKKYIKAIEAELGQQGLPDMVGSIIYEWSTNYLAPYGGVSSRKTCLSKMSLSSFEEWQTHVINVIMYGLK